MPKRNKSLARTVSAQAVRFAMGIKYQPRGEAGSYRAQGAATNEADTIQIDIRIFGQNLITGADWIIDQPRQTPALG
jgi:hypothetical protein